MIDKSGNGGNPPRSLARRHFMSIAAAGAGRLSAVVVASSLLASKSADALGLFPRGDPREPRHPSNHCFGPGTLVQTASGEVAIEDLTVGSLIMTTRGVLPVQWVGRRRLTKTAGSSWHPSVLPVRIARFAIDHQTPRRDLYLSQTHSLLIDGLLIPVKHLVNGSSIVVDHDANASDIIEYFCVKLETHDAMFAEGTAAETFQHRGGQIVWDNLDDYVALYGGKPEIMQPFAPHCAYKGGRAEVGALLRLAVSPVIDLRDPIQIAYVRIASRATSLAA